MITIYDESKSEVFDKIIDVLIKKEINGQYTLDAELLVLKEQMSIIKRGNKLLVDNEIFVIEEYTINHNFGEKIEYSIFAEHISYLLLNQPLGIFSEDEKTYTLPARELIELVLLGSEFTLRNSLDKTASVNLKKDMNKKEALLKIANAYEAELSFEGLSIDFLETIGQNNGYEFNYSFNLKEVTVNHHKEGIEYSIDFAELASLPKYAYLGFVNLGDTVIVKDEVLKLDITTRIMSITYNPIRRINSNVVLGNRLNFIKEEIESKKEILEKLEELEKKQAEVDPTIIENIVEVFKQEVISVETAHILNAWIRNLFVESLQTNFDALDPRISTKAYRNYIDAKENSIDFKQSVLSDELEDFKLSNDVQVYWTAINNHPDAYKFFTITSPENFYKIDETKTEEENEILKQAFIESFKVKIKKQTKNTALLKIGFIDIANAPEGSSFPVMIWGQGDGITDVSSKGKIYKNTDGLVFEYFKSNTGDRLAIELTNDGIRFHGYPTIFTGTAEPAENLGKDGDIYVKF